MKVVLLAQDGAAGRATLRAIAAEHRIVGVITPAPPGASRPGPLRRALSRFRGRSLRALAGVAGAPFVATPRPPDEAFAQMITRTGADVTVMAGFPWLLGPRARSASSLGTLNVHAALLPRHRGVLPLFWIYHSDDRETGVSVHWADAQADAGDIVAQQSFALSRGRPVDELNQENASLGAQLLRHALSLVERGSATRTPQDDRNATLAPWVRAGTPMIDFSTWGAERCWHFLAGLLDRWTEPMHDADGNPVRYRGVRGFELGTAMGEPGRLERRDGGWLLHCRDGRVLLGQSDLRPLPSGRR